MLTRVTFSLDDAVLEDFRRVCKDNYLNQSAIVTAKLLEIIKEYDKEEK